jgi:hypothetical protein
MGTSLKVSNNFFEELHKVKKWSVVGATGPVRKHTEPFEQRATLGHFSAGAHDRSGSYPDHLPKEHVFGTSSS